HPGGNKLIVDMVILNIGRILSYYVGALIHVRGPRNGSGGLQHIKAKGTKVAILSDRQRIVGIPHEQFAVNDHYRGLTSSVPARLLGSDLHWPNNDLRISRSIVPCPSLRVGKIRSSDRSATSNPDYILKDTGCIGDCRA